LEEQRIEVPPRRLIVFASGRIYLSSITDATEVVSYRQDARGDALSYYPPEPDRMRSWCAQSLRVGTNLSTRYDEPPAEVL
jgi:hypothetical protein